MADRERPALYISHNGADTPLVQSQVIPYLEGLVARGFPVELFTFERASRPARPPSSRFRWHPLTGRSGPGLLDKAIDLFRGTSAVLATAIRRRAAFTHARSYVPAAVAYAVYVVTRRPYLFDMRGFLPQEYVDAGYWTTSDIRYRALRFAERVLLANAREIVVLTHRAAAVLREDRAYAAARNARITVIPCAVDLERFRPARTTGRPPTLVYSGSLGSWYELGPMLRVYALARRELPDLRMLVLNQREHELVRSTAAPLGIRDGIELRAVAPSDVPASLNEADVAIALIRQAPSKLASSAVKISEYLACGLPTIVNRGLGDVSDAIAETGSGFVLKDFSDAELALAAAALVRLIGSPTASANARRLAERDYDLAQGIAAYAEVYERLGSSRRDR